MTELIGHQLGQYAVTEEIGKGGMATVYKATQASMKRTVAIKILPRNLTHDDKFLARFYREVEIAASLQHPHILPVYDFGEYDGMPYIVMAYMNGGTLADLIAKGRMETGEITRIVQEMSAALDFAHSKGVIHRDFKPSNVLLDEQKHTYLADFGLAKLTESTEHLTGTGILGTPTYMAPEQAEPNELTLAADVYALGVTIFQMLTGRVPYEAPTPLGVLMAHITQPVPDIQQIRPELSHETQVVIGRSMAKEVDERYPSSGALSNALAVALKAATKELKAVSPESTSALLMTNMLGQVIFMDQTCLQLLRRRQSDARAVIGKPLHEVLGIERTQSDQLIQEIGKTGKLSQKRLEIKDSRGKVTAVWFSATATRDDKNAFVGADITLKPVQEEIAPVSEPDLAPKMLDTSEESFLEAYFVKQMTALRNSMIQLGGQRLGRNLDTIINETAQRNVWPVTMENGQITVQVKNTDSDIYRALLAKGIAYAVNLVGKKMVMKGMQAVDKQLDPRMLEFVRDFRLYELFDAL
jgi:serine/threonine protein kinase